MDVFYILQDMPPLIHESDIDATRVDLSKLMAWYLSHCNGVWEHGYGLSIVTLDNPGWMLKVNLIGTNLEGARMDPISEDSGLGPLNCADAPWIECGINDNEFVGASDPTQLPRLISIFNSLIDAQLSSDPDAG